MFHSFSVSLFPVVINACGDGYLHGHHGCSHRLLTCVGCVTARAAEVPSVPQHFWCLALLLQEADLGWSSGLRYDTTTSPACAIAAASPFSRLGNGSAAKLSSVLLKKSVCLTVTKEVGRSIEQGNTWRLLYAYQPDIRIPNGVHSWELPPLASSSGGS